MPRGESDGLADGTHLLQETGMTDNHYDPGLHLFVDDCEVQDHPGFTRLVLQPARNSPDPVICCDRPWEGIAVVLWGSVLYDEDANLFKMWYFTFGPTESGDQAHFMCYATSTDGTQWEKPEWGIVPWKGSMATNIVYPPPSRPDVGMDPWGVVKDVRDADPSRRYKMGGFQERLGTLPSSARKWGRKSATSAWSSMRRFLWSTPSNPATASCATTRPTSKSPGVRSERI